MIAGAGFPISEWFDTGSARLFSEVAAALRAARAACCATPARLGTRLPVCPGALAVAQEKPYNELMDAASVLTDDEVRAALAALAARLRSLLGTSLARLVLYGSRARGDAEPDSDIDVAVIVRDAGPRERDRILGAVADVELESGVPLSTLILSLTDYSRLLKGERRLALDIEREGVEL